MPLAASKHVTHDGLGQYTAQFVDLDTNSDGGRGGGEMVMMSKLGTNTEQYQTKNDGQHRGQRHQHLRQQQDDDDQVEDTQYRVPKDYFNLDELAGSPPLRDPHEQQQLNSDSFEGRQRHEPQEDPDQPRQHSNQDVDGRHHQLQVSSWATQLYTISYLIFFSFLGTLARLGLQALTFYPGSPIAFSELWANVGGCIVMGFLAEDRKLFQDEWGTPTYHHALEKARGQGQDVNSAELQAAKKAHAATKKTIPLFIGLATGFCGCFTSFSSFVRDVFLALANATSVPDHTDYLHSAPRNGGYSFMALLAVIITTVALCLSGLFLGAHIAVVLEPYVLSLSFRFHRKWIDPLFVLLAFGCWLGAVLLAIFPPDAVWRGRALFSLVFAPLGCLARFYLSILLNGKIASFPLGTFTANILGTAVLGMCWDLQHVPLGGVLGCQVLQGVQDGFCGCLTTVSTWVVELSSLRRGHAYRYGSTSVVVGLAVLVVIMGTMKWTVGLEALACSH